MTIWAYLPGLKCPALMRPPMVPTGMARNLPSPSYLNHEFPASRSTRPSPSTSNASMPSAYLAASLFVNSPAFHVDGDGRVDLLAGNSWFKYEGDGKFRAIPVGTIGGRNRGGDLQTRKYPQNLIPPRDRNGPPKL